MTFDNSTDSLFIVGGIESKDMFIIYDITTILTPEPSPTGSNQVPSENPRTDDAFIPGVPTWGAVLLVTSLGGK
jgi:hypothetical protein